MRESCKGPPDGPRVTLCRSREQAAETLRFLSAGGGEGTQSTFCFRTQERMYLLRVEDIRYFAGRNHRVYAVLRDGSELESVSLRITTAEFLEPLLGSVRLLHISRTTYVNPLCVRAVEAKQLYLDGGAVLKISRNYAQSAVAALERMSLTPKRRAQ